MARRKTNHDADTPEAEVQAHTGRHRDNGPADADRAGAEGHTDHAAAAAHGPTDPAAGGPTAGTGANGEVTDRVQRAEEMVDRIGERVGYYTSWVGHQLLRLAARAREEVEDIVAEAQDIRQQRNHP